MNKDKYVVAQMIGFLYIFKFLRIVKKSKIIVICYVKVFTCWNQLLTIMFGLLLVPVKTSQWYHYTTDGIKRVFASL